MTLQRASSTDEESSPTAADSPIAKNDSLSTSTKPGKEKRKRSRVTPEQLVHLERFFLIDRSPTATRRRDISELLGMQERQTQIWFQNRRAKAKLQDNKNGLRDMEASPESTPGPGVPSSRQESSVHRLIHEDEPVSLIPCTDLTIGSWRRIASAGEVHDLVAYVNENKRCLNWYIHSGGYGFKMEIPFHTVAETEYKMLGAQTGIASLLLAQPPAFYLEHIAGGGADEAPVRTWKRCSDWTEGHQASSVLRHTVVGSDAELVFLLRSLHAPRLPPSPMELPLPPLAALDPLHYAPPTAAAVLPNKRPLYAPGERAYNAPHGDEQPGSASGTAFARQAPGNFIRGGLHASPAANFEYGNGQYHHQGPEGPSYGGGSAGFGRPYGGQGFGFEGGRSLQGFQDGMSPRISQPRGYSSGSPTGFSNNSQRQQPAPPTAPHHLSGGMPGLMYNQADNLYSC